MELLHHYTDLNVHQVQALRDLDHLHPSTRESFIRDGLIVPNGSGYELTPVGQAVLTRAGLRVSEALSLRVADVNLNARSGWLLVRKGKGMKERRVPLSAEARRALRDYLDVRPSWAGERLFVARTGRQMTARDVQRLLQEAARRAGIPKRVTPHGLRHTFATRFLQAGGDIATLAEILEHERIATTTRYLHPDAARMQEMSEVKPSVSRTVYRPARGPQHLALKSRLCPLPP